MSQEIADYGFLGEEFLTWLWFQMEDKGGEFTFADGRVIAVAIDDYMSFAPRDDDDTEHSLRHGLPSRSAEASAALRNGRRLAKARLIVAESALEWSLTLVGNSMTLGSVKLPQDSEDLDGPEERSRERAAKFLRIHEIIGQLYKLFLERRLRPEYLSEDAEQQAQWMAVRSLAVRSQAPVRHFGESEPGSDP